MDTLRILSVVGARPNFVKIAPLVHALAPFMEGAAGPGDPDAPAVRHALVHTGQHYDVEMSDTFFRTLGVSPPDVDLGVGSGTHAQQVGQTMIAFEKVVRERRPDWIVVVGDVNATCACAITAKKEHARLAHIEAGLRSFDLDMPEEINRMVTDRLSDLLFTTDEIADANLLREGVPRERIRRVGNIMIDTLEAHRQEASRLNLGEILARNALAGRPGPETGLQDGGFVAVTLHRPSNVDRREVLQRLVRFLADEVAPQVPLVWTVHPRTRKRLADFGLWDRLAAAPGVTLVCPLDYREMLRLNLGARVMCTDSGGLQEECCLCGTPCITLRENTERPVTLSEYGGLSELAGNDVDRIRAVFNRVKKGGAKTPHRPPLWDGQTAGRIVEALLHTRL